MKHNEKNLIVENVLSEEEISEIYKIVEKPNNTYLMKLFTQTIVDFSLPSRINKKIIDYSESISGESDLEIAEYQFARYKNTFDEESQTMLRPNLTPHCDLTFREPRFTFDYQLGGNTTWGLVVEQKEFTLENNSALTFSGTHQVHWRKHKIFEDNEYIDMIFFHLRKRNSKESPEEHSSSMESKVKIYSDIYHQEITNDKN
jgi:hypothetical protein